MPAIIALVVQFGVVSIKKEKAVAFLNISGLSKHLDGIKLLLNDLRIQILALSETKLNGLMLKDVTEMWGCLQNDFIGPLMGSYLLYIRYTVKMSLRDDVLK